MKSGEGSPLRLPESSDRQPRNQQPEAGTSEPLNPEPPSLTPETYLFLIPDG